jgi:hypothetical protein
MATSAPARWILDKGYEALHQCAFLIKGINMKQIISPSQIGFLFIILFSTVSCISTGGDSPMDPPKNIVAVAGDGQATVHWKSPGPLEQMVFMVLSHEEGSGECCGCRIKSGPQCPGDVRDTSCTVVGLTNGTSYYFSVKARSIYGRESCGISGLVTPMAN